MDNNIIEKIKKTVSSSRVFENVALSEYTSFKTGGPADIVVRPKDALEVKKIVALARDEKVPYYILGNGTNMLISDDGFRGIIISLKEMDNSIQVTPLSDGESDSVLTSAGCTLARLSNEAASKGLAGLEFAAGIPGSVGGAVVMNAGAYGSEMKDVVVSAQYIDEDCSIRSISAEDMDLSYRHSLKTNKKCVITSVTLKLEKGDPDEIRAAMSECMQKRSSKQPLDHPSAGSTFKRPEGSYASLLIDQCGLKGMSCGGAQVSEKHSGFVINTGDATCSDVLELCGKIKNIVKEKTGYLLELEPEILS